MITKAELNELGFHKIIGDDRHFTKPGYLMWVQEVEPGSVYNKVAIRRDLDGGKAPEFEYFYSIEAIERYFERHEPVNPNNIDLLQKSLAAPYTPKLYNPDTYSYPSEGY